MYTCAKGPVDVLTDVEELIADAKKGDMGDIMAKVMAIVQEVPTLPSNCKDISDDETRVSKWLSSLIANPTSIMMTLVMNYEAHAADITADIAAVPLDFMGGKYIDAGEKAADGLVLLIGQIPQ